MRVVHLLGHFAPDGALGLLVTLLRQDSDALVRKEVARTLEDFEQDEARDALEAALLDPSPDVRIASIRALSHRKDAQRASPSVLAYVEREQWSDGLKPALQLLAQLKDDSVDEHLDTFITDTSSPRRAYLAAQALERARRSVRPESVSRLLYAEATSFDMRRQLIESLAWDETAKGEEVLLDVITKAPFGEKETPRSVEILTKQAMMALGRRRSNVGKPLLVEIVRDDPSVAYQLTALRALSFYPDPELAKKLVALRVAASPRLKEAIDNARRIISRRADVDRAAKAMREFEQKERRRQQEREEKDQEEEIIKTD